MTNEMLSKVLTHQLEGIMFHADAMAVSCLNGYDTLKRLHYHQAVHETEAHMLTLAHIVTTTDEIVEPAQLTRTKIANDATRQDILEMWRKWEMETKALYLRMIEEEPECRLWVKLYKSALGEVTRIDYML